MPVNRKKPKSGGTLREVKRESGERFGHIPHENRTKNLRTGLEIDMKKLFELPQGIVIY
ncbi:hypothetical protein JCGZ_01823 [Jatropha curcas]|uniref:Uncharacterized protein n=1 Tax=Jatropha curcas TaxID=180498 RepID=A0A067JFS1_JATCU|nr:hypothetical protein JCGZ_01823 [Jatropha curcas]